MWRKIWPIFMMFISCVRKIRTETTRPAFWNKFRHVCPPIRNKHVTTGEMCTCWNGIISRIGALFQVRRPVKSMSSGEWVHGYVSNKHSSDGDGIELICICEGKVVSESVSNYVDTMPLDFCAKMHIHRPEGLEWKEL